MANSRRQKNVSSTIEIGKWKVVLNIEVGKWKGVSNIEIGK